MDNECLNPGNLNLYAAIIIPTFGMVSFLVLNSSMDGKGYFGLDFFGDSFVTEELLLRKTVCELIN